MDSLSLDGFSEELVTDRTGIEADFQPISMAFLPDNRILLLSKTGVIRIVDPESGNSSIYMTLNVDADFEKGLLDITLDPDFESNGLFYLYFTPGDSPLTPVIAKFQHVENDGGLTSEGDVGSQEIIWQDTDGYLRCCHYGGGLDFGPDGKIWLTTSDKFRTSTPGEGSGYDLDLMLNLASSSGKIIRINSDGTIPDGSDGWAANPFIDGPGGNDDSIWAYGLRNPFRARWDFEYGQMYIGEVGGNQQDLAHEDLHTASLDQAGAFYGWPFYEGTTNTYVNGGLSEYDPNDFPAPDDDIASVAEGDYYSAPIWSLAHNGERASMTAGEVYRGSMFPEEWNGVFFYGDYTRTHIRYLVLDETGTEVLGDFAFKPTSDLPDKANSVAWVGVGNDGALYWAEIGTGEVRRIVYEGPGTTNSAPIVTSSDVDPEIGGLPLEITFNAIVTDPDGDALTYTLNFGDASGPIVGNVGSNGVVSVSYTYTADGRYLVSFSVTDGSRTTFSPVYEILAGDVNYPPAISGEGASTGVAEPGDTEVTFSATVSDPNADAMTYTWHFGDGHSVSGQVPADGIVTASHVFEAEGSFDAYLEVSDGTDSTISGDVTIVVGEVQEVPVTNGLSLLLQSNIKIGLTAGSTVVSWLDGSGNGNNLIAQGNPQLLADQTPTGQPAIVFDGSEDLLERVHDNDPILNLPSGSSDRTVFLVVDYINPNYSVSGVAYGDGGRNKTFGVVNKQGELAVQGYGGANDFSTGVDGLQGGFLVQSAILSAGTLSQYRNGTLIDTDAHSFNTQIERLIIGGEINDKGQSEMKVAAVLIYNRALSESERVQVENFLKTTYISGPALDTPPVANDDLDITVMANSSIEIDVLANDLDPDGDSFQFLEVSAPGNGTAEINDNGTPDDFSDDFVVYTPDSDFFGTDGFMYTIVGDDGSDSAVVSITVTPSADMLPPDAVDDNATTERDTAVLISVLSNDTDPTNDPLTITSFTPALHGTVEIFDNDTPGNPNDDQILYTPNSGFVGEDSFSYTIADDDGSDTAVVTVSVAPPPGSSLPVALDDTAMTPENVAVLIDVMGNDYDDDGDPFTITAFTSGSSGTVTIDDNGTPTDATDDRLLFTPNSGFAGTAQFTYTITDDDGSDTATVSVTVGTANIPVGEGLVAAFESDMQVSTTGGNVVVGWIDSAGLGNDLAASGNPLLIQNATPTGAAAIRLDGVDDFLERTNASGETLHLLPSGSSDRTMFFVLDYGGTLRQPVGFAYGDNSGNETFGLTSAGRKQAMLLQGWGGSNDFDSGVPSSGWVVQSVVLEDNVFEHYLNGELIDIGTHQFATDPQRLVIGEEIGGAGRKPMDIGAAFIFDEALSDEDRMAMETYLQQKYINDEFVFA
ncbi:Ig-like domain-containing protein [Paracoccus sp. MBLB3053]|uniref:Ig-like domain-containing protein n=1 Tax=Paracoccus aurantius TaxID=3073814 RepID=A0ABU2HV48_9RHOB|nr:Ig-like domain-containing protein [Paracoccus sp. MBLB3053]MDS9468928.1 Ig-like domain-containing protein [Paracoccus sp. MBLB3053]